MRRSQINALLDQRYRQAANDPWIRVGETRTSVKDVKLESLPCLLLESTATREVLANNPIEGQTLPTVVRKIVRTKKIWVAEDGSIVKTFFEQTQPEAFTVEMIFGQGVIIVHKTKDGKRESGQIELTIDPDQFENEYLSMAWGGKVFKDAKTFATLDPFAGGVRTFAARMYGPFAALEGKDRVNGVRVEVKEGKAVSTAWVTNDGRLLQYDLASGERLIVEPKDGAAGVDKGRGGG